MMRLFKQNNALLALVFALAATLVLAACAAGAAGSGGTRGSDGPQGAQGAQGSQGPQGAQGYQGYQGPRGVEGSQGPQGEVGDKGPDGIDPNMYGVPDRTGPSSLLVVPNTIAAGSTGMRVLGAGFAPDITVTLEFHRLFYAGSQVIRATPIKSSRYQFATVRANASGAFEFVQPEDMPFPEAVLVYLDDLGVDQAVFTVLAIASDQDEASFPVLVRRPEAP